MLTNHRKCQFSYMLVKTPSGEHLVAYAVCYPLNTFIQKNSSVKQRLRLNTAGVVYVHSVHVDQINTRLNHQGP